jgi:hypothetical protein
MINIIFTGLISIEERFKKSILEFRLRKSEISQIIVSTWLGELDKYKGLRNFLDENCITIVESVPPTECKGSILFQMKSLHVGLDSIKDKNLMIFKTRPDLYIDPKSLIEISNLDLEISDDNALIFEKKIWVPWFEITKPFYLADECIYATYNDMKKLVNYDMIYDSYYVGDSGLSHVRRFIHPFLKQYPIFNIYLKYLSTTAHGTPNRFDVLNKFLDNEDYHYFLNLYYYIVRSHFYIGLEGTKDYILFREWSAIDFTLPDTINEAFTLKYSWKKSFGHIYSNDNQWLDRLKFEYKINFIIDEESLRRIHKYAVAKKTETLKQDKFSKIKKIIKILIK